MRSISVRVCSSQTELLEHRLPEMPASLVPVIEEIWLNEVVGK